MKNITTEFEFKELISGMGFYCKINISIILSDGFGVSLNYDKTDKWYSAVFFATKYFYEDYSKKHKVAINITVNELDSQIVDTSNMVALYVTLMALYNAVGLNKNGLMIDEKGILHLPK